MRNGPEVGGFSTCFQYAHALQYVSVRLGWNQVEMKNGPDKWSLLPEVRTIEFPLEASLQ